MLQQLSEQSMQITLLLLTPGLLHLALLNKILIQPWSNCNRQVHNPSYSILPRENKMPTCIMQEGQGQLSGYSHRFFWTST